MLLAAFRVTANTVLHSLRSLVLMVEVEEERDLKKQSCGNVVELQAVCR